MSTRLADATPEAAPRRRLAWRRVLGVLAAVGGLICVLLLAGHRWVPDVLGVGSLLETFLPWLGLAVPVLAAAALQLRSWPAGVAVLAVAVTWVLLFGTAVLPRERAPGPSSGPAAGTDLRVLTHNLGDGNPRLAETAQKLARVRADVVALQEIRPERLDSFAQPLDRSYPYRMVLETFAVWSRYPLTEVRPVETGPRSLHAVRMVLVTPKASVVLYVVHLISPDVTRRGFGGPRDETMAGLTDAVARDGAERIILVGDLNTAPEDRRARRLLALLDSAQDRVGHGFGFTWPARLPMTRIDHVLTRGVTAVDTSVLGRTGSDHRPVLAELRP